jgi:DNA-binding response OmpR family regulator
VLLIEADACFRETVRRNLAETGHPVLAIRNSRAALKQVLACDFALLLYDPTAPGLSADMF